MQRNNAQNCIYMKLPGSTVKIFHPRKTRKCSLAAFKSPDFGGQSSLEKLSISRLVQTNFALMLPHFFPLPADLRNCLEATWSRSSTDYAEESIPDKLNTCPGLLTKTRNTFFSLEAITFWIYILQQFSLPSHHEQWTVRL